MAGPLGTERGQESFRQLLRKARHARGSGADTGREQSWKIRVLGQQGRMKSLELRGWHRDSC